MRGDASTIKEKLSIVEIVSGYIKLEKAGISFKARCPFHNEKTPSFFVSPARQNFYCFGCGAKGDIFTFVEQIEGLDFRDALKLLADKAGVELVSIPKSFKDEKNQILNVLEQATQFFENELDGNEEAKHYLLKRGLNEASIKKWRIGYAPSTDKSGWRSLWNHLKNSGYDKKVILSAGLAKISPEEKSKEPYDVFRDRLIFPLFDQNSHVVAFSGRALSKDTEPKYLNSPETPVFKKSELLFGLDKAKNDIRRKNYSVLVEGQMDLVLSHQAGVENAVAASGTAFTQAHLERLKHLSPRIILAFDADMAGEKAAERAAELGMALGLEVKIADLPEGKDPAELVEKDVQSWKDALRRAVPAVEFFLKKIENRETDKRKLGKLIENKILPKIKLLSSSIEQSHFISMISKRTGLREDIIWADLKRIPRPDVYTVKEKTDGNKFAEKSVSSEVRLSQKEMIEERLAEIKLWKKELKGEKSEEEALEKEQKELESNLSNLVLKDVLNSLTTELAYAEEVRDDVSIKNLGAKIKDVLLKLRALEEKKKLL